MTCARSSYRKELTLQSPSLSPGTWRKSLFCLSVCLSILFNVDISFPGGSVAKNLPVNAGDGIDLWVGKNS